MELLRRPRAEATRLVEVTRQRQDTRRPLLREGILQLRRGIRLRQERGTLLRRARGILLRRRAGTTNSLRATD